MLYIELFVEHMKGLYLHMICPRFTLFRFLVQMLSEPAYAY